MRFSVRQRPTARRLVFFIDPISASSYPVTETGYALLHRAWARAQADGDVIYVVYPDTWLSLPDDADHVRSGQRRGPTVLAHRIEGFDEVPYAFFRSQKESYRADADIGSPCCHREAAATELCLTDVDAIVFRQEVDSGQRRQLLEALAQVEDQVLVYLSPKLALEPRYGSKVLPHQIAPSAVPKTFDTASVSGERRKISAAVSFFRDDLAPSETAIVKPRLGDNGEGITVVGRCPLTGNALEDPQVHLRKLVARYGDVVVQEYVPSVRTPEDLHGTSLQDVSMDRRDFGEIRFILIDGTIPRTRDGRRIVVARRVPTASSLVADSGISYPTTLSEPEHRFLDHVGREYMKRGIFFGGGDLIRTPNPERPFVFTDAARSVCGHAVVTGALNGEPYLIVDLVLDSIERHLIQRDTTGSYSRAAALA